MLMSKAFEQKTKASPKRKLGILPTRKCPMCGEESYDNFLYPMQHLFRCKARNKKGVDKDLT